MITIVLIAFAVLLVLGMPIAFVMGVSSMFALLSNPHLPGLVLAQKIFTTVDSFSLMAIPFFMLAGHLMNEAGITKILVKFSQTLVGHIKGGLAQSTVLAGMLMAGISGSANADASAIGGLMVPTLKEDGYEEGFVVSLIASTAALGPIIPPSIMMIIYSSITNISVAKLFLAGFVPGILSGVGFMVICYFYARKRGYKSAKRARGKEIWGSFKSAFWALLMPLVIMGGILSGVFTATEAGVIAVVYGLAYGLISKKLTWKKLETVLLNSVISTVVPMLIIAMAAMVSYILARENLPLLAMKLLEATTQNTYVILLIIIAILFIIGMFIDPTAAMLMLVPVFAPLIGKFGYDPIHFAMIIVLTLVLGGLTPPVGMLLYIVASVEKTPLEKVVFSIWPFIWLILGIVILTVFVPEVVTLIPSFFMQ
jgi:C4-dicarboxylate transporter DctM subunit